MKIHLGRNDANVWAEFRILVLRDYEQLKILVHVNHVSVDVNERLACFYRVLLLDQGINYKVNFLCNVFYQDFLAKLH